MTRKCEDAEGCSLDLTSSQKRDWDHEVAEIWFQGYAKRAGYTVKQLRTRGTDVYPCTCDYSECKGWAAVRRDEVYDHFQLYAKDFTTPV